MKIAIMQPGYLPWLGFFELMVRADLFVFLDDVQYTVRDWRNRNRIRTDDGWQWLSVPVLHKGYRGQLIKDVMINKTVAWQKKHLNSMKFNYQSSKYFKQYYPAIRDILLNDWETLADLNIVLTNKLVMILGIDIVCSRSSELKITSTAKSQRILDICQHFGATELYDSKAAEKFLDIQIFVDEGIKVDFQQYNHPVYNQSYSPFISHMSLIDLLFNHGPDSLEIIRKG